MTSHFLRRFTRYLPLALLIASAQAAVPPAERLLPADTLAVVCIPDCARAKAGYAKSANGQLFNDPAMKPIREKFLTKFRAEFWTPLERELGMKLDDYSELAQGQLTIAITQDGWNGQGVKAPAALLLLDTKDKSGQLRTNLASLRKKWIESGKSVKTEKIRGNDFMVIPLSTNDTPKTIRDFFPQRQEVRELGKEPPPKNNGAVDLYIGQFETLLIVGNSAGAVEKVVAHLTGGSAPALADEALFDADRLAVFRESSLFVWFNARRFLDVLVSLPPDEPNPEAPSLLPQLDLRKILSATGLLGLKTIAGNTRYTDAGTFNELFIGAPESTRQGFFKILAVPAKDASPPPFVPADAGQFQRYRVDGQQAFATLEKMLAEVSPQLLNFYNYFLDVASSTEKDKDPNFSLKKNFIGSLGDDIIAWTRSMHGAPGAPPSLILIGSPNAEKLAGSLKTILAISPMSGLKEREFLGRKVYSLDLAGAATRRGGRPQLLNFAAGTGYVALSTDTAMLEEYLRNNERPAKPLRELSGLAEAAQKVGGQGTGLFTYENQAEMMREVFENLKKLPPPGTNNAASFNPLFSSLPFAHPEKNFRTWLDFTLLPEFDRVSKYFTYVVFSGSTTVNGVSFRSFSPAPPPGR